MRFLGKALERLWFGCGGGCHLRTDGQASCPLLDGDDPAQRQMDPQARRFSTGAALGGAAAIVFLLPLATGIGGAYLAGHYLALAGPVALWQAAGLLAGLAVGVAAAKLLLFLMRSKPTISGGGEG